MVRLVYYSMVHSVTFQKMPSARTLITTQNHNFVVVDGTTEGAAVTHKNLNDGTIEGLKYEKDYAFSLQFEPSDDVITEDFVKEMEEFANAVK